MKTEGDCYEIHAKTIIGMSKYGDNAWNLCHGEVWHFKVGFHGHCWLENDKFCFDVSNENNVVMRKDKYYELGKIKNVRRYTGRQAAEFMVKTEHYGPWEDRQHNGN